MPPYPQKTKKDLAIEIEILTSQYTALLRDFNLLKARFIRLEQKLTDE